MPQRAMALIGLTPLVILSVALGVSAMPGSPALTHDSAVYLNSAQNLLRLGRYQIDMADALAPQSSATVCAFTPGYSIALSLLLSLGLGGNTALYVITCLGLVLFVGLFYMLAWRLAGSLWAALVVGIGVVIFPPILDVMTYALSESLYLPTSVLAFLIAAIYLQSAKPRKEYLLLLALPLALAPLIRFPGLVLAPSVGGILALRSLKERNWRRAAGEVTVSAVSQLPVGLYLLANPYCGNSSLRYAAERTTRPWLAQLLLSQFTPRLELDLGLRGAATLIGSYVGVATILSLILVACVAVAWRYREPLRSATLDAVAWAHWPILAYVVIYLGGFFWAGDSWAKFDFPRYLAPTYPFLILLTVLVGHALYRHLRAVVLRGAILMLSAGLLVSNAQATARFIPLARQGRGIEAPEIRDHPVIAYLHDNLHESDLLYSTKEPTLWYYLRRPVRRLADFRQLSCQQLPKPAPGGRMVFVFLPFYVYSGSPIDPADVAWVQKWIGECGTIIETRILSDTAAYMVEPKR